MPHAAASGLKLSSYSYRLKNGNGLTNKYPCSIATENYSFADLEMVVDGGVRPADIYFGIVDIVERIKLNLHRAITHFNA